MQSTATFFNNTTNMVTGSFYKPDTVLDNIARSQQIANGVLVITARDVSGRIAISNNKTIIGSVVDGTGETGIAAVCKLLLLPFGNYSFRRAVPLDLVQLNQELNLNIEDAKTFLSGTTSIGLALPAEQALSNLRQHHAKKTDEFSWEKTNFRVSYNDSEATEELYNSNYGIEDSGVYLQDCNRLLETESRRRTEELAVLTNTRQPFHETPLVAGPLPQRKQDGVKLDKRWVYLGALVIMGLVGFSVLSGTNHSSLQEAAVVATQTVTQPITSPAPKPPEAEGRAPFAFPSTAAPATAPANYGGSAAAESSEEEPAATQPTVEEPVAPVASNVPAPPAPAPSANQEVTRWMDKVRSNPGDANARKELSFAYLVAGDPNSSIEQFYAAMKLQKMESSDIITFANNLQAFAGRDRSRQFLLDVLRMDPMQAEVRERLNSLH